MIGVAHSRFATYRAAAISGDYLGPTIRVRRGEDVRIRVRNTLPEPTLVRWHGAHLPAASDGGPHQRILASGSFEYRPSMPDLMHGYGGNALLANGALKPYFPVRDGRG